MRDILTAAALAGGLALGATGAAAGEARNAGQLATVCSADPATEEGMVYRVFCYGYMTGVMQFHRELRNDRPDIPSAACPNYEATRTELAAVFVAYVKANPDVAEMSPIDALGLAAADKWPCAN